MSIVLEDNSDEFVVEINNNAPGPQGIPGPTGEPGPNEVTDETDTNLTGPLFGDGSKVRVATSEEVVSESQVSALLLAALPAPLAIAEGRVYTVPENQQVAFRFPIAVDGVLRVDGILYEV